MLNDDQTYVWKCPRCENLNTDSRSTEVECEECGASYDFMPTERSSVTRSPVKIDLNGLFTVDDVKRLIGSVEDDRHWTLVINYRGEAYLLDFDEVSKQIFPEENQVVSVQEIVPDKVLAEWDADIERDERLLAEKSDLVYLRFETYGLGNNYVGESAATDDGWVQDVYNNLKKYWPRKPTGVNYIGD